MSVNQHKGMLHNLLNVDLSGRKAQPSRGYNLVSRALQMIKSVALWQYEADKDKNRRRCQPSGALGIGLAAETRYWDMSRRLFTS